MAKPTLMTDIKAHIEVVPTDAPFAIYYNPDTAGDLADKIRVAHAKRAAYAEAAPSGRTLISKEFTWDRQAEKLVAFLDRI